MLDVYGLSCMKPFAGWAVYKPSLKDLQQPKMFLCTSLLQAVLGMYTLLLGAVPVMTMLCSSQAAP